MNKISRFVKGTGKKVIFQLKKYAPEICLAIGIGAGVGTVVTTAVSSYKLKDELAKAETKTEKRKVVTKLYLGPVILGTVSVAGTCGAYGFMRKKYTLMSSTAALTAAGFEAYRKRVAEKYGEDVDKELMYGKTEGKKEVKVIDEKTGKEKTQKQDVIYVDPVPDRFVFIFSRKTVNGWDTLDINFNLSTLKTKISCLDRIFKAYPDGTPFYLSDALRELDYKKECIPEYAQVYYWKHLKNNPDGDNKIEPIIEICTRMVDGEPEDVIMVDFNCDGRPERI